MSPKPTLPSALPHFVAGLLFVIIAIIYFTPVLENKVLSTHDGTVFTATSKEIVDHREKYQEEPLWTESMFGGMPTYLLSTYFPGNLIKPVYNLLRSPGIPLAPIILLMAGFYFLLVVGFRVNPWLAIVGSVAYGFSSYFFIILTAGHNTKALALAFLAPLIGSIIYSYRKNRLVGSGLVALFLSLQIIANHLQITYYTLLILLLFGLFEMVTAIKEKKLPDFIKTSLLLIGAALIAVAVNFSNLYTTFEYSKYSMRGKSELTLDKSENTGGLGVEYATQWSYGIDETLTFLIPNLKGGASIPFDNDSETVKVLRQNDASQYIPQFRQYWGSQTLGTSGPVYVGAIVFLLFIMGLVLIKDRDRWWILIATLISIMLAWGKNFLPLTNLFFDYFPGYNKFRAVTMILVIAEFCIPLLGLLALDKIFKGKVKKAELYKALKIGGGITIGILILYLLIPGIAGSFISTTEGSTLPDWIHNALVSDRKEMLKTDVIRSLLLVISTLVIIYFTFKEKFTVGFAIILIGILIVLDMWPVNKRYLNNDDFISKRKAIATFNPSIADNFILNDNSQKRVLNLTVPDPFSDGTTSYYHQSIGGYHGAKIRRYQDLISASLSRDINLLTNTLRNSNSFNDLDNAFAGLNALNMLNTKYIIISRDNTPLINPEALGNAWFVESYELVNSPDEELLAVNRIDPSKTAVIDNRFEEVINHSSPGVDSLATITLDNYKANELTYSSSSSATQLAIFSEIYYPKGWNAYINGEKLDIIRANYILRAAVIPAGNNKIVFRFDPSSYRIGNTVSLVGSLLLIAFLLVAAYIEIKKPKSE